MAKQAPHTDTPVAVIDPMPLRAQMPALANKTYFNYGGQGPLPSASLEAITAAWTTIQELGPFSGAVWPYLEQVTTSLRQRLASWFGVSSQRVALTENVTSGCVLPLWGLPWEPGDELLIGDCEHPGVVAACRELARRQGLSLATLPVQWLRRTACSGDAAALEQAVLEQLQRCLRPRTRLVVLSHLLWNTGQVMPIAAVAERLAAHPRRPWLLVDGAQSLGSLPLADAGAANGAAAADIYGCTGHKWCCGPEGLGAVVLSERLLAEAHPTLIGWRSLRNEGQAGSDFHRDGRRFEVATSCTPLMAGLTCSLRLLEAQGSAEQRLDRIQHLSRQLWHGLGTLPGIQPLLTAPPPAGLVSFQLDAAQAGASGGDAARATALVKALGQRGVWIRSLDDPICLRACTHITTTEAEVELLLHCLAEILAGEASVS
ncbi:Isopenicillin N epimerase [Synechococcus sp. CBW1107]|nr:Isopenicillin N epimerase [Synechococcus sp. CBW1107]